MLPLYCGYLDFLLNILQTKQNEAMRIVTKKKWEIPGLRLTSTKQLLKECGYLSIKQMAYYYSVASVHKMLVHCEPEYLHEVLTAALSSGVRHRYPTSHAGARPVKEVKLEVARSSFRWRANTQYALLPATLREEPSLNVFLTRLKEHTRAVVWS